MNWSRVLCLVVVALTAGEAKNTQFVSGTCTPGETFIYGIYICECPPSGIKSEAWCEYRSKPSKRRATESGGSIDTIPENLYCQPGEKFLLDDQWCCCPRSGLIDDATCFVEGNKIACPKDECRSGSLFFDSSFQLCFCLANGGGGQAICVPSIIIPPPSLSRGNDGTDCVPGEEHIFGNLICKCPKNGELLIPRDCIDSIETLPGDKCIPGELFQKGFETCLCPESGFLMENECPLPSPKRSTGKSSRRGILPSAIGCLFG